MNNRHVRLLVGIVSCALVTSFAGAQEATERYIPIGESPGISGYESIIGTVVDVDYAAGQLTVATPDGSRSITVDGKTRYYLDRSQQGASNQSADLHACKVGRRVEAAMANDGKAKWVKIEAPPTP